MSVLEDPCPALTEACEEALQVWGLMGGEWRPEALAPACALAEPTVFDGLVERLMMIRALVSELRERRHADRPVD